jgi:5-methyltetrahydropteroyltriglutamate--homocysteine methyltransferase
MTIKQTPVGSLPRSPELQSAYAAFDDGNLKKAELDKIIDSEIKDVVTNYEKIDGNPIITTGEVEKPNFLTYFLEKGFIKLGKPNQEGRKGFTIEFEGHHAREMAVLQKEQTPFKFAHYGDEWISTLKKYSNKPFKATVIAPSAVSLIYKDEIDGYSKEQFINDLVNECVTDVKKCIASGAAEVGMDMTEATYAIKVDPTGGVLKSMVGLIDAVCEKLSPEELNKVTLHTCFGADNFTNHNYSNFQDVYPALLKSKIKNFHLPFASLGEGKFEEVLKCIKDNLNGKFVYLGFVSHLAKDVETPKRIAERIVLAKEHLGFIPGVSECCGYSPFCNDLTTTREWAFEKIKTRTEGAKLAAPQMGL